MVEHRTVTAGSKGSSPFDPPILTVVRNNPNQTNQKGTPKCPTPINYKEENHYEAMNNPLREQLRKERE
jgi:hypothetical protein